MIQIRPADLRPQNLAPILIETISQLRSELESGALITSERARSRVRVAGIQVVRETITETVNGEPTWEYTTDVVVIFILDHGAVGIAKGSHHTEMLAVIMARDIADLDIPDRSVEWADDLMVNHRSSREFISLGEV